MDKYTVERQIGSGNYGEVYLVRNRLNGTLLVCKKIDMTNKTPAQQKEAENEIRVMSQVAHPNIVGFIEAFVENKIMHIVMEFCDADDLEKTLIGHLKKREWVPEETIARIFVQIVLALRQLHKQHLLHRDLKSANVFMTSRLGVKLGDFGFSKQLNYTMALASTVCGTPYYFSPELCQKLPYNNKSDVWSLGVILYEMINLRKPFEAKNLPELRKRVVTEDPAPFATTHVSQELKDLCMMCLRKSSAQRPSVEALLQVPYVRKTLAKFSELLVEQRREVSQLSQSITLQHPRGASEPEMTLEQQQQQPQQGEDTSKRQRFPKSSMAAMFKSGAQPPTEPPTTTMAPTPPPAEKPHQLHTRELPNARGQVSNNCPLQVVGQLTEAMLQEQNYRALADDVQEVLESIDVQETEEIIGEPESNEERLLRGELGDQVFLKVVGYALQMSAEDPASAKAEMILKEILALLGSKQYLLADVQKVSVQFEVDE